jgi:RNA polymerase sigma-70 factor, ECF subfamily
VTWGTVTRIELGEDAGLVFISTGLAASSTRLDGRRAEHGSGRADPRADKTLQRAIAMAKDGDRDAIRYLYVRYAEDIYGYVRSILHDSYEAEDITQQVFAKLMRVIGKYEPRDVPFSAWILRVAHNLAIDHVRRQRLVPCEEVRASDESDDYLDHERAQALREALAGLPPEQRKVLVLRHVAGLSPGEIAERMGKTEGSIHGLHHRGRLALRAALSGRDAGPATIG